MNTTGKEAWEMTVKEYQTHGKPNYGDMVTDGNVAGRLEGAGGLGSNRVIIHDRITGIKHYTDIDKVKLIRRIGVGSAINDYNYDEFHKNIVNQALSTGKPVPAEVLKDYPDLAKQKPKVKYKTYTAGVKKSELYELKTKIKEIETEIKESPVRRFLPLVMKSGNYRGEVKTLTKRQYRELLRREPREAIIDKTGRIPWHYAFDELATESGYHSDEEFKEAIEKLSGQIAELRKLKSDKTSLKTDIVKAETEKPKPETVKREAMEPPVFNKQENTIGEITTMDNLEVTSRRNPSFWQTEIDDKTTEKSPDVTMRVRYKNNVDKLTRAAVRDAQDKMIVRISKRTPRITPKMPRLSPKMPKLR